MTDCTERRLRCTAAQRGNGSVVTYCTQWQRRCTAAQRGNGSVMIDWPEWQVAALRRGLVGKKVGAP
jgi:hypothetical protein